MKILCDRHQLTELFAVAAGIAPLKTTNPVVKNALLRADENGLTLFATDFEISARLHLDSVKVKTPGTALLPAKETYALLRELEDATVTVETKDFKSSLHAGGGQFELVGSDPSDFPEKANLEEGHTLKLPAAEFLRMVRSTAFSAAREESRYAINGVMVEVRDSCLRLVATDGRRLALCYRNLDTDLPDVQMIVPLRALQALTKALPETGDEEVNIVFSPNQAGFLMRPEASGETMLVSTVLDRQFPDYEGVIPRAADTTVEIPRTTLEANLRRVAVLSSGDVRLVHFRFSSSSLELSAESSGIGRGDVVMDVDVKGPGGTIGFNPDFVLDALKICELETVRLDMTDEETPAKLTLGESTTYVLMPISNS